MAMQERPLEFRSEPTVKKATRKYDILRVKAAGVSNIVILGDEFLWHKIHYWRGRTIPHFGHPCEACDHGTSLRERGYIAIAALNKTKIHILEVTDQCQDAISDALDMLSGLRGQVVRLGRVKEVDNGKLFLEFMGRTIASTLLPASPDVGEVMSRVWGMGHRGPLMPDRADLADMSKVRCVVPVPGRNGEANGEK